MSTAELDAMATKQLLADLKPTIPSPGGVQISVLTTTTDGHESKLAAGL